MPIGFLSDAERERLDSFPAQVVPGDIETYFTHSRADRRQVPRTGSPANRLGFALQLGTLRFGPVRMAQISDLTYQKLAWCTKWYIRDDTLKAATTRLVNFQYCQPLSRFWGTGMLPSSDGQQFPVSVKVRMATALPPLRGRINRDRILRNWDDLLRMAGSLKRGCVTASLLIGKLQSYPRKNRLTRALQEYGRLAKTVFILRYLESEDYRRRILGQLNKGEALHGLRELLLFASKGTLRKKQEEELRNQAGCLNLVTNAVVTWNTV